ncbi:MAG: cytochrome c [Bacteroidia bacterium]|nr:cytochrome c [Bacteroidia bacterium]MDW8157975.1 cytochrome c [Bacteroidia bacterium]
MDIGFLHLHHFTVVIYILLLLAKVILLLANQKNLLITFSGKTRVIHIGMVTLMLITGIYLAYRSPVGTADFSIVKYIALLLGIVLGIIGIKKLSRSLAIAAILLFGYAYGISMTNNIFLKGEQTRVKQALENFPGNLEEQRLERGKAIYQEACLQCHGEKGDAQFQKAWNLATTPSSDNVKAAAIKYGRNRMPRYDYLTDSQIADVVAYINTFKTDAKSSNP